jgi:hypothetical protein
MCVAMANFIGCSSSSGDRSRRRLAELRADTVAVLHVDTGTAILGELSTAVAVGSSYFALSSDRVRILRFSASGTLDSVIGRTGSGPGEFSSLDVLTGNAAGVLIKDDGRYHRLSVRGAWISDFRDPRLGCGYSATATSYVCSALSPRAMRPFVVIDTQGQMTREFGPARGASTADSACPMCQSWGLYGDDGATSATFAAGWTPIVERWDLRSSTLKTRIILSLPPSVLPGAESPTASTHSSSRLFPPGVRVYSGWVDSTGDVTLVFKVPGRERQSRASAPRNNSLPPTLDDFASTNTVIVQFDRTGTAVAERIFVGQRALPGGGGLVSIPEYTADGFVQLRILRVSRHQ